MNLLKLIRSYLVPAAGLILAVDAQISSTRNMKYIKEHNCCLAFGKATKKTDAHTAEMEARISDVHVLMTDIHKTVNEDSANSEKHQLIAPQQKVDEAYKLIKQIKHQNTELDNINNAIAASQQEADKTGTVPLELINNKNNIISNINKLKGTAHNLEVEIRDDLVKCTDRSDISEIFTSLIDNYRDFLDTLDTEKLVALINFFGFYIVLVAILSITFVTLGDRIIENLNLGARFPKLAKYIKLHQTIRKGYLYIHIFILYLVVVGFIICNLYLIFV